MGDTGPSAGKDSTAETPARVGPGGGFQTRFLPAPPRKRKQRMCRECRFYPLEGKRVLTIEIAGTSGQCQPECGDRLDVKGKSVSDPPKSVPAGRNPSPHAPKSVPARRKSVPSPSIRPRQSVPVTPTICPRMAVFLTPSDNLPAETCGGMLDRLKMTLQIAPICGHLLV